MSLRRHALRCLTNRGQSGTYNAFIHPQPDVSGVRDAVEAAEEREAQGCRKSIVDGRLIAIKDNISTASLPTTCASNMLDGYISPYAATVVKRLQKSGAIVVGKTNLDEFGMGSHSTHSKAGPVLNPHGHASTPLSAGGSSGGSAVAIALEQCWAALGTDTGGSVRLPAAYNGVFGFKPSYGLISRHGIVAYTNSLDTVGILGKKSGTVSDVFDVLNAFDAKDPTSLSETSRERIHHLIQARGYRKQLRVGVPLEYNISELDPVIRSSWTEALLRLQARGHSIHPIRMPTTRSALPAYYVLAPAEASSNLAKYDGVRYGKPALDSPDGNTLFATARGSGFGREVKRRILLGTYTLSASALDNYFIKAQRVRRLVQKDFDRIFSLRHPLSRPSPDTDPGSGVDVLLSPTTPSLPPTLESLKNISPTSAYKDDVLTVPVSLAGLPAISVPFQVSRRDRNESSGNITFTGLQVAAQYGDDKTVLQAAKILEEIVEEPLSSK